MEAIVIRKNISESAATLNRAMGLLDEERSGADGGPNHEAVSMSRGEVRKAYQARTKIQYIDGVI